MIKLIYLFNQTIAVNSLYPPKTKIEVFQSHLKKIYLNNHKKFRKIILLALIFVLIGLLLALAKFNWDISMVESGKYYYHLKELI